MKNKKASVTLLWTFSRSDVSFWNVTIIIKAKICGPTTFTNNIFQYHVGHTLNVDISERVSDLI